MDSFTIKEKLCSILKKIIIMSDEPPDQKLQKYAHLNQSIHGSYPKLFRLRNFEDYQIRHLRENILSMSKPTGMFDDDNESVMNVTQEGICSSIQKQFSELIYEVFDIFYTGNIPEPIKNTLINNKIEHIINNLPKLDENEAIRFVGAFLSLAISRISTLDLNKEPRGYMRKIRRMACFSDIFPRNPAMWKNFGAEGAGFVLEYDFNNTPIYKDGKNITSNFASNPLFPVIYDGMFDANNLVAYLFCSDLFNSSSSKKIQFPHNEILFIEAYRHKVKEKVNESEWRFLSEILGADSDTYGTDITMRPTVLYCGPKMAKDKKKILLEICLENDIKFLELDENYNPSFLGCK